MMTRVPSLVAALAAVVGLSIALVAPGLSHEGHDHPPAMTLTPVAELPAGQYELDLSHTSLILGVDHLGLSTYRARFTQLDATLDIDPAAPADAVLSVTVDAASLETQFPFAEPDFNATLTGPEWLDAEQHRQISYVSTAIDMTGAQTARVTGELTLHGVTKPVVLDVTFNGGYGNDPFGSAKALIGFSATGAFDRSDFGITNGLPAEGSTLGVGDRVEMMIEAEFLLPGSE